MNKIKVVLIFIFGIFLLFGGVYHFINPVMYDPFIPDFLPKNLVNYGAGVLEITLGIGTFISRCRNLATLGILLLMIAFLPLHVIDVFKEHPAIGSHQAALVRLPLQFILILWAWFINKK